MPRVLVVDDDARVRAALARVLATLESPAEVETAGDAVAARDACRARDFDLAVVDVSLPDPATGLGLISELAAGMPVLATSVDCSAAADALASGAFTFVEKDGATDRLVDILGAFA